MKVQRIVLIAAGVAALVAVAPAAQGGGGTPITTCGQTVTSDAVLKNDLVCTGDGIIVGAGSITIDLKGHTIRGDNGQGDFGIDDLAGYKKVTVMNGALRNFNAGIAGTGADKLMVTGVYVSGNIGGGIIVQGDSVLVKSSNVSGNGEFGISLVGDSVSVVGTTAAGNFWGISVSGDAASVKSSHGEGNFYDGIDISGTSALVAGSTASGNGDYGVHAFGTAQTIKGTTVSGNGINGIWVYGDAATIQNNVATGNGFPNGVSDLVGVGITSTVLATPPTGTNIALGNDDSVECDPVSLC